jgi:hypothetical protein
VRELTGGDSVTARRAGEDGQPAAPPPGTTCEYAMAEGFDSVFRFCFKDGRLAQKAEIHRP